MCDWHDNNRRLYTEHVSSEQEHSSRLLHLSCEGGRVIINKQHHASSESYIGLRHAGLVYNSRPAHIRQSTSTHIEPLLCLLVDHVCRMKTTAFVQCRAGHTEQVWPSTLAEGKRTFELLFGEVIQLCLKREWHICHRLQEEKQHIVTDTCECWGAPVIRPRHQGRNTAPGRGGPEPSPP